MIYFYDTHFRSSCELETNDPLKLSIAQMLNNPRNTSLINPNIVLYMVLFN